MAFSGNAGRSDRIDYSKLLEVLGDDSHKYIQAAFQHNVNSAYINELIDKVKEIKKASFNLKAHREYLSCITPSINAIEKLRDRNIDVQIINIILDSDSRMRKPKQINSVGFSIYGVKVMMARYFAYRNAYPVPPEQPHHIHFQSDRQLHATMKHKFMKPKHIKTKVASSSTQPSSTSISQAQQKDYDECLKDIKVIYAMIALCSYTIADVARSTVSGKSDSVSRNSTRCISQLRLSPESTDIVDLIYTHLINVHYYWIVNDSNYQVLCRKQTETDIDSVCENIGKLSDYDMKFIEWIRDTIAIFPVYIIPNLFEGHPSSPHFMDIIGTAKLYISPTYNA
jgi:uncharacterized protein (UPF0305 family)